MTQAGRVFNMPPTSTSPLRSGIRRILKHPVDPLPLVVVLTICAGTLMIHMLLLVVRP